ncbi:SDR family NAD(P)-dependent oxidoreductase [Pseudonocardia eucalypti]|uniref:SDR family NAD(P)-dependent oxidoreductase n=1 Tax=Pseudonocardia eucalypti TaxID=648755 RepID=A0ABP9Q2Z3_9PSEU|nr:NAD(P)-dependent dehydrogenase (short-subunit alcohol dehydrogenase family) [Pseudonocardia eucalypti]
MTRILTPFGAASTAAEVVAGVDLTGRRIVVTGGASGIGVETARALAGAGAEVTLAVRDLAAGERTAAEIAGAGPVRVAHLDLADQASVAAFVAGWTGPLHVLVNNAGVMAAPETRTPEGWELQFATNHLGHFALTTGLYPALREAAAATGGARIVSVSSSGHLRSPVVFEDIHFERRAYEPWSAYGQSKTANALLAVEATRRWADDGITANALMPGGIRTRLQRHVSEEELEAMRARLANRLTWKNPEQGAATSVLLAVSPLLDGIGGRYFEDCNEAEPTESNSARGVAAYALDPEAAERLWQVSEETLAVLR